MHTALLRQQHHEIVAIVNDMRKHLLAPQRMTMSTAESLGASLVQLGKRLASHLQIEDRGMYPRLQGSPGSPTANVARRFSEEMVGIVDAFHAFQARWPDGAAIHADRAKFVDECTTVFHDLSHRIEREEKELYPMVDAHV